MDLQDIGGGIYFVQHHEWVVDIKLVLSCFPRGDWDACVTSCEGTSVFGRRVAEATYVRRPSVYAVITNGAGQVAVVRTAQGVFLPGGGIERGETPEQAVLREALEECRLDIRLLSRLT